MEHFLETKSILTSKYGETQVSICTFAFCVPLTDNCESEIMLFNNDGLQILTFVKTAKLGTALLLCELPSVLHGDGDIGVTTNTNIMTIVCILRKLVGHVVSY